MEMAEVGIVRTRASAALAMDVAVATAATSPSPDEPALKRRKIKSEEDETSQDLIKFSASSFSDQLKSSIDGEERVPREAAAEEEEEEEEERSSDESPASCCSSNNGSSTWLHEESIKFLDLEVQSSQQAETSACYCENQIRREMSLTSELGMNWQEVESSTDNNYNYNNDNNNNNNNNNKRTRTTTIVNNSRVVLSTKMPTELELEEFFATAEKDIQKRFSDKYNFDIVKDLPLEGRYEWIQVKLTP